MTTTKKPVTIITGSTKGIGRGIAEVLVDHGHAVVITSRDKERAENYALALREQGHTALGVRFDLEEESSGRLMIDETIDHFGRLDCLVNNALSTSCVPNFQSLHANAIEFAITSNITNTLLLTKAAYPHLKMTRGSVINMSSIIVSRPILTMALYAIVKGAIVQMTKALAAEWAGDGIRVNAINPGFVYSNSLEAMGLPKDIIDSMYAHCEQFHPLENKIGKPVDVGNLVAYMASEEATLMTGSIINIDGGLSIQGISIQPGE